MKRAMTMEPRTGARRTSEGRGGLPLVSDVKKNNERFLVEKMFSWMVMARPR